MIENKLHVVSLITQKYFNVADEYRAECRTDVIANGLDYQWVFFGVHVHSV